MKTNQDTINKIIWKACDTFRGTMNSSAYMDYILTMLFVKFYQIFTKKKLKYLPKNIKAIKKRLKKVFKMKNLYSMTIVHSTIFLKTKKQLI